MFYQMSIVFLQRMMRKWNQNLRRPFHIYIFRKKNHSEKPQMLQTGFKLCAHVIIHKLIVYLEKSKAIIQFFFLTRSPDVGSIANMDNVLAPGAGVVETEFRSLRRSSS